MEGEQLRCPICGKGHEGSSSCDISGEESSVLLQNYVKGLSRYYQEDVNFGGEESMTMVPCKGCSFYLKAVVNGMESVEGLNKDVAMLEQNLWRKLRELKSNGDYVLSQLKHIKESIINRQIECMDQNEIYLRKGTEKSCTALAVPIAKLEEKLDQFKKWSNTAKIETEVECSSSGAGAKEPLRIVSVTSMATSADDDNFEAGEVFQVKTEPQDDDNIDIASTGDGEPVVEGIVKIEKEFVRETRQGNVYRTKEVSFSFGTGDIVRNAAKCTGAPMLIDLEEEETRSKDVQNMSVSPLPSPPQDIHLEKYPGRNEVDDAESSEEVMQVEVEEEEVIPSVGIVAQVSEHEGNMDMETFSEFSSDTSSKEKTELLTEDLPIAGNSMDNPDDDNNENKKWFSEVTARLTKKDDADLKKLLEKFPKLSPGLFHELVLQLNKEKKLYLLIPLTRMECFDFRRRALFHEIFRTINVQEATLDVFSEAGLDFNVLDPWKRNVLHSAIKGNQSISLLKSLVKRGANVKQTDSHGENLINFAVSMGCTPQTLEFLINEGVTVEMLKKLKLDDPERSLALFKIIFNAGAHYPSTVFPKYIELTYEKCLPHLRELFEFIISNGKIGWFNTKNSKGATPLHLALGCWRMEEDNLQMLANTQADFSIIDNERRGCLHYAIAGGNWSPKMLQILIDKGALVTTSRGNFETLLHIAASNRSPWETFEFLLDKGLEIGHKNSAGYTALDLSLKNSAESYDRDQDRTMKLFIKTFDAGVRYSFITTLDGSVGRYLSHRNPILHVAIEYGTLEVVKHLLENGVDANELDSEENTPFLKAIGKYTPNGLEKAKLLRRFGAMIPSKVEDRKEILHDVVETERKCMLMYCIGEFEVGANATLADGTTLLHSILFAEHCSNSKLSIAEALILEGADVNAKPEASVFVDESMKLQSPLHLLLYQYDSEGLTTLSFVDMLILILERGANINEKSLEGWTALHILMNNSSDNSLELAKLLVQFGADIHAKTKKGQSVLHIAAKKRDVEKIQFCLSKGLDVNALDIHKETCMEYLLNLLPADNRKFQNEWICRMTIGMKVLLESGATAETKANLKHKIETRLGEYWRNRSDLKTCFFKEMLSLLK